jgi:hypothetical protein
MADCVSCGGKLPRRHNDIICDHCREELDKQLDTIADGECEEVMIEVGVPIENGIEMDRLIRLMAWPCIGPAN